MLKKLVKFKTIGLIFLASFIVVCGGALWAYFILSAAGGALTIHFNDIAGINQLGRVSDLLLVGGTAAIIVVVNFFLTLEIAARDKFFAWLFTAATLVFAILIFIGFAAIINFS
jgi:amino acid permease